MGILPVRFDIESEYVFVASAPASGQLQGLQEVDNISGSGCADFLLSIGFRNSRVDKTCAGVTVIGSHRSALGLFYLQILRYAQGCPVPDDDCLRVGDNDFNDKMHVHLIFQRHSGYGFRLGDPVRYLWSVDSVLFLVGRVADIRHPVPEVNYRDSIRDLVRRKCSGV